MPTTRSQTKPIVEKAKEDAKKKAEENLELAKQYWWFCGHATATIVSVRGRMHACEECSQSRVWEYFYVDGQLRTGN